MSSSQRRRFSVGDVVIWTDYADGSQHRCTILSYVELDRDDDYDGSSGPLYAVEFTPGQHGESQVAEADLSPLPPPSLRLVDDDQDDEG